MPGADLTLMSSITKATRFLRVCHVARLWSMSFGSDLRATVTYGERKRAGEPHIIWRRIGRHHIYRQP